MMEPYKKEAGKEFALFQPFFRKALYSFSL